MATIGISDSARLLREQYKDGSNLSARIRLHQRFSTNRYGQMRWLLDQIRIAEDARVLELGCGTGILWRGSVEVPRGWRVILTDMSGGMLHETRAHLARLGRAVTYMQADAQSIPFRDESFDAVIANHMLYHVPDIARALESGEAYMRRAFSEVTLERYPDSLVITEAAPLMDYICSMRVRGRITDEQIAALRQHVEREIATHGEIRMTKDSGVFIARR
jgi:2-polyprenyl-3-methyl-5-hydroxy-6-metoxy-1,4-benzoquinol methylase